MRWPFMLRSTCERREAALRETIEERHREYVWQRAETHRYVDMADAVERVADCLRGHKINRKDAATRLYTIIQRTGNLFV